MIRIHKNMSSDDLLKVLNYLRIKMDVLIGSVNLISHVPFEDKDYSIAYRILHRRVALAKADYHPSFGAEDDEVFLGVLATSPRLSHLFQNPSVIVRVARDLNSRVMTQRLMAFAFLEYLVLGEFGVLPTANVRIGAIKSCYSLA